MIKRFYKAKNVFISLNPEYHALRILKQNGGGFPEKIKVTSDGIEYRFVYEHYNEMDMYMMYTKRDKIHCVMILIDVKEKNAVIEGLSGDYPHCPNGSKLLKASIKFLKENKDKFGIKRIVLKDNSMKACFGKNIIFGDMYTLLYGTTWYTSHGFLPYNQDTSGIDKNLMKIADKNKKIVKNTLVSDVKNLKKYIDKYAPRSNFDADKLNEKIDALKKTKLSDFLKWLLRKYDKYTCTLFYNIYEKLMVDLGIQSLHARSFYMKL